MHSVRLLLVVAVLIHTMSTCVEAQLPKSVKIYSAPGDFMYVEQGLPSYMALLDALMHRGCGDAHNPPLDTYEKLVHEINTIIEEWRAQYRDCVEVRDALEHVRFHGREYAKMMFDDESE